jgi:hypothetical protein
MIFRKQYSGFEVAEICGLLLTVASRIPLFYTTVIIEEK